MMRGLRHPHPSACPLITAVWPAPLPTPAQVMLPAQLLSIPETTPEQAVGLLQAAAGGRAAAPGAERAP